MKKHFFFLFLFFICTNHSFTQEFRKYANNYLYQGVDARGRALGNAITASSTDVFSSYWNPAGLSEIDKAYNQVGYMHVFDGLYNYDVAGLALPTKKEGQIIAISALRYGVDDIPNTIFLKNSSGGINYDNITTFSSADYGVFLSYAKKLGKSNQTSIGGSAKILHRNVGEFAKAWGVGVDAGIRHKSKDEKLQLAAMARDLFGTYSSWNFNFDDPKVKEAFAKTGNKLPQDGSVEATSPSLILAGNYLFDFGVITISPEANLDIYFDGERGSLISSNTASIDPHAGLEIGYDQLIFLRGGINNIQKITDSKTDQVETDVQPSFGAGVQLKTMKIDYALTQYDFRQELTHLITLNIRLKRLNKK